MARALACVVGAAVVACTWVDSVDGYAGGTAGPGGSGGSSDASSTGGSAGKPPVCTTDPECDDGNACTTDVCWAGACSNEPLAQIDIVDDNTCTIDSCDPKTGIQHVMPTDPPQQVTLCGTVTCPAGYFVRKLTCLTECGACNPQFCVNGVVCERPCTASIDVCCGNDCASEDCPSGYAIGTEFTTGECSCGPGKTITCTR